MIEGIEYNIRHLYSAVFYRKQTLRFVLNSVQRTQAQCDAELQVPSENYPSYLAGWPSGLYCNNTNESLSYLAGWPSSLYCNNTNDIPSHLAGWPSGLRAMMCGQTNKEHPSYLAGWPSGFLTIANPISDHVHRIFVTGSYSNFFHDSNIQDSKTQNVIRELLISMQSPEIIVPKRHDVVINACNSISNELEHTLIRPSARLHVRKNKHKKRDREPSRVCVKRLCKIFRSKFSRKILYNTVLRNFPKSSFFHRFINNYRIYSMKYDYTTCATNYYSRYVFFLSNKRKTRHAASL